MFMRRPKLNADLVSWLRIKHSILNGIAAVLLITLLGVLTSNTLIDVAQKNVFSLYVMQEALNAWSNHQAIKERTPAPCDVTARDASGIPLTFHRLCVVWFLFSDNPETAAVWLRGLDVTLRMGYSNLMTAYGRSFLKESRIEQAARCFQLALTAFPKNVAAHLAIFDLESSHGDWKAALATLHNVPVPDDPETAFQWWYRVGRAATELDQYGIALQAYDQAMAAIQRFAEERGPRQSWPTHVQSWVHERTAFVAAGRADLTRRRGDIQTAIAYWRYAAEILPRPWYYEQLVYLYRQIGDRQAAIVAVEQMAEVAESSLWKYRCLAARLLEEAGESERAEYWRAQAAKEPGFDPQVCQQLAKP
jgi:tetratricopeptide (TPR) repeat protein